MASAREEPSWKLSTHQHKHWTRDTGWLTLSTYVRNGREAGDQRRRWTKPESHSPRHKSKNLTDIFKPLFLCRENIALVTQGQASFHLHRRSVVSPPFLISFLLPEFFSSADLQCTPFNGPLPPRERSPLSSPPPSLPPSVSHSLFLPRSHRQHLPRLPSLFTSVNSVAQRGWLSLMNSLFSLQPGADF